MDEQTVNEQTVIKEWIGVVFTRWQMVMMNYKELIRECENDSVLSGTAIPIEFLRTFNNYMASVISLWDQTIDLIKPEGQRILLTNVQISNPLRNSFQTKIDIIRNSRIFPFMKKLRNYVIHARLPKAQLSATITFKLDDMIEDIESQVMKNAQSQIANLNAEELKSLIKNGGRITTAKPNVDEAIEKIKCEVYKSITLLKRDLQSYHPRDHRYRWNEAKHYLNALPETIDIKNVIIDFHRLLLSFYEWFGSCFISALEWRDGVLCIS